MNDDEKLLWDLFCTTGEPRYYSMYAKLRSRNDPNVRHGENVEDGE